MITLYGFGPYFGLPEASPYVMKAEVQLKMAKLAYVKAVGSREDSPKGQLPYIDDGDERISDTTFIRLHLEKTRGIDLDAAPDAIREQLRDDARARVADVVRMAGPARHSLPEIVEFGTLSLSALSMQLGWKDYLMGDRPCGADAIVFGVLAGLLTPFFDSPLRDRVLEFSNLVAYVERMMGRYYPEHPWQRLSEAA
jgi:glutathione S-transferase